MSFAEIYYRGKSEIINDNSVEIVLPESSKSLTEFTVQIIPNIYGRYSSQVENGKFTVYGKNGSFFWNAVGFQLNLENEIPVGSKRKRVEKIDF